MILPSCFEQALRGTDSPFEIGCGKLLLLLCRSPVVSVAVRVQLQGEEYHRYIAKYGNTYSHSPSMPPGWLMAGDSGGGSHIGADHASWGWRFHGPEAKKQEVVDNIEDFFEGFNYHLH